MLRAVRTASINLGRVLDDWAVRFELWWDTRRPAARAALAFAAVIIGASLVSLATSGIGNMTATRPVPSPAATPSFAPPSLAAEAAPADAGRTWTVLNVWQGSPSRETESFTVGAHWRVDWLFSPTQPGGEMQIFIYAANGRLLMNMATNTQRPGAGSAFWAGAGTYFLRVNATGGDWKLDVQDLR